jgi:hypothetical protein
MTPEAIARRGTWSEKFHSLEYRPSPWLRSRRWRRLAVAHYAAELADFVWIYPWLRAGSYSIGFPVTVLRGAPSASRLNPPSCPENVAIAPVAKALQPQSLRSRGQKFHDKDKTDSWSYPIQRTKS